MKREKISGCLIVKNESENLEKCIKSMMPILNELIVVDTGSTDNTVEIAKKYTNKVYIYEWKDDFSDARNFAIAKARHEWIIFLDADEYFSEGSLKSIRKTIDEENGKADALMVRGYNIAASSGQIADSFSVVRIFRNKPELRYHGRIHESLRKKGNLLIADCTDIIEFFHTGYNRVVIANKNKNERNFSLLLKEMEERPTDGTVHFYLSLQYIGIEDYEKAIYHSQKALEYGVNAMGGEALSYVHYIKSGLYLDKDVNLLIDKCYEFISKHPKYPDAYLLQTECLLKKGDFETAASKLEEFLKTDFSDGVQYVSKVNENVYKNIYEKLGDIYCNIKGDFSKAVYYYAKLLNQDVYCEMAFTKLISILVKFENSLDIMKFLQKIYNDKTVKDMYFLGIQFAKLNNAVLAEYYKKRLLEIGA